MKNAKRYLVTGNWFDKVTKQPKSGIAEVTSGIGTESKQPYEMANTKNRESIDGTYPVGTFLTATVNISVEDNTADKKAAAITLPKV